MNNLLIEIIISALATWRVCHLLAHEDGPFDILIKLAAWLDETHLGKMMNCVKCLSIWFSLMWFCPMWIRILLAISALVVLLEEANVVLWRAGKPNGSRR